MKIVALLLSVLLSVEASSKTRFSLKQSAAEDFCIDADDFEQCVIDFELSQVVEDVIECDLETGEGCEEEVEEYMGFFGDGIENDSVYFGLICFAVFLFGAALGFFLYYFLAGTTYLGGPYVIF